MTAKRMKSREIRDNWRDVLDHVRAGNEVVVEHYNKPIARIVPVEENAMSQARHIIEREGPYWAVRDTYVRGVVMAYDRSEDVARARAALLDAGGSLEHLPHCPRCGEMVPADGDGMVMSHSIPDDTPANPDWNGLLGRECGGTGTPRYLPADEDATG